MDICYPSSTIWNLPDGQSVDPADRKMAEMLAWTNLQALYGYSMAICPIVARPCRRNGPAPVYQTFPVSGRLPFGPALQGGAWINCACGGDAGCGCGVSWVELPGYIGRIDEVKIGDTVLAPDAYRVDGGVRLVRQDGEVWPDQNLALPLGEEGTWSVAYFQGDAPTTIDDWAAGLLAMEFLKALTGDKKCKLPARAVSVVRNGVQMELSNSLFLEGSTGIEAVDRVIAQRNPYGLRQPSQVASPDSRRRGALTTWSR